MNMNEIVLKLRRIEEALRWRKEWDRGFDDKRSLACVRVWSDDTGVVTFQERELFSFESRADFEKKADELIEKNRYKTNIERVDWGSTA
jgi:hypothetical protein